MRLGRVFTAAWLVALAATVLVPATAQAHPPGGASRVAPSHVRFDDVSGRDALEGWFLNLSSATGPDRCVPFGRSGNVLLALGEGPQTCTVEQGTAVFVIGLTSFCDSASPPQPRTRAAQIECAWRFLEDEVMVESVEFTIDGGRRHQRDRGRDPRLGANHRSAAPDELICPDMPVSRPVELGLALPIA